MFLLMLITLKDGDLNARSTTHNKWCFFVYGLFADRFAMENYFIILKSVGNGLQLKSPTTFGTNYQFVLCSDFQLFPLDMSTGELRSVFTIPMLNWTHSRKPKNCWKYWNNGNQNILPTYAAECACIFYHFYRLARYLYLQTPWVPF